MKIKLSRNVLKIAIDKVAKNVGKGTLSNILFVISKESGKLITMDDSNSVMETSIKCDSDAEGKFVVDAKMLENLVKNYTDDNLEINVDDNKCSLKASKTKTTLPMMAADTFPAVEIGESDGHILSTKLSIVAALSGVDFAAAINPSQPVMGGMHIVAKDKILSFVALDGHRVAKRYAAIDSDETLDVIVETKLWKRVLNSMTGNDIQIWKSGNGLVVTDGTTKAQMLLVDGQFFDIDRFVQATAQVETTATFNVANFRQVLRRMSLFADTNSPVIMEIKEGEIVASIKSIRGENLENVDAKVTGNPLRIGFNTSLLDATLAEVKEEEITINFGANNKSPLVIRNDGAKAGYFYMLLPVSIR